MLTRRTSSDAMGSTFEWDGMDMVRELSPVNAGDTTGVVTRYYVVNGALMSFERSGVVYQVHADAVGHVRLVTNGTGAGIFSSNYDAWGSALTVSDSVPSGGWMYRYMGICGCRTDTDAGLVYCRARWLDANTQRFISRDMLSSANRYQYAYNNPVTYLDYNGLAPDGTTSKDFPAKEIMASPYGRGVMDAAATVIVGTGVAVGVGAAALALGAPAAAVYGAAEVVGTVGLAVGVGVTTADIAQAVTGRDLAGYPISSEQRQYLAGQATVGLGTSALGLKLRFRGKSGNAIEGVDPSTLKCTQAQSKFDSNKVSLFARMMKERKWDWNQANREPLIVDSEGRVMSGHHRVLAAQRSNTRIPESAINRLGRPTHRASFPWPTNR